MTNADFETVASAFVDMAHRIVWATAATVDPRNRPRTRVLHPLWSVHDGSLRGVIATGPTRIKRAALGHSPHLSLNYWSPNQDTCRADCRASWSFDDERCTEVWELFANAPAPVGYDPSIIPAWTDPTVPEFAVLELEPYRLRVMPGTMMTAGTGEVLNWAEESSG